MRKSPDWHKIRLVELLKIVAKFAGWATIWLGIPAVLLYPVALWVASHTSVSENHLVLGYGFGIAVLWIPTAFLVDFLYRRFALKRSNSN